MICTIIKATKEEGSVLQNRTSRPIAEKEKTHLRRWDGGSPC